MALKEVQDFCANSSVSSSAGLRYMPKRGRHFGGNFSTQKRKSYFRDRDDELEIPCGFMTEFPVTDADWLEMEKCRGVVVASAIFGDHDKIRQPRGIVAKTLEIVCFFMFIDDATMAGLNSHNIPLTNNKIGVWRIVKASGILPYENPAMNGVIPKHLIHRLFPNSKFGIWVDAKLQLTADPFLLIHSLLISEKADMAISQHPFNVHTMEEAMSTARWKKWDDLDSLRAQMEAYCENGLQPWSRDKLPYTSDVPDSALILRKHGVATDLWSCLVFNELEAFNPRDQLAFAYVRDLMRPQIKINMFAAEVFEHVAVEYRHNVKHNSPARSKREKGMKISIPTAANGSKCEEYLSKMWGEVHD
ncbi:hypothetical protein ACLOJK_010846 [Asimina triloba]